MADMSAENRTMFRALDVVANGDHSDNALDALCDSCQAWKRANPSQVEFSRMPRQHHRMPGERLENRLPTTGILAALRSDNWSELGRIRDEWQARLIQNSASTRLDNSQP